MRNATMILLVVAALATGCTRSEPAPDKFAGFSPEGRALAESFERDRAALKSDMDRMTAEMDAIMPALDEVIEQAARENDRLVSQLGR